jgi:hypothetical protein
MPERRNAGTRAGGTFDATLQTITGVVQNPDGSVTITTTDPTP